MIELRMLGPARVTVDGEEPPAELTWRKNLALLAYLALASGHSAARGRLAGLLWGDKPEKAARGSLAEALRLIRRSTDDGIEEAGAGYVRLADGAVETDTARFTAFMEAGDAAAAADLVAGELLEGLAIPDAWEFEEWLAGQRRAWSVRSEHALITAAESALAAGEVDAAHQRAERALALIPTSEPACRTVMRALCLRGDRGGALARFAAFSEALEEAVGVGPSADTLSLAERVRRQRAWRLPAAHAARSARGAESRRAPLVGRADAMRVLVREWESLRDGGGPRVVVITGDAGTGRTRLLDELLQRARLDGADTGLVRAVPADRSSDGEVVETLLGAVGVSPAARGGELVAAVREATRAAPMVLAVDDAGWADDASLEELRRLVSRGSKLPLMLVLVAGSPPGRASLESLAARLGRDLPGALVQLGGLDAEALRQLTAWAMPEYDDDALDRLARRVRADTAGHPLLAVELLHGLAHGLSIEAGAGEWPATGRTLEQTRPVDLPETLVAAVRVGYRILTPEAQQLLAAVAVLGAPAAPATLAAATGLGGRGLHEALDELEWEHWLVADARGYAFSIPLVHEIVARDMVTAGQKRRILAAT